jgi:hypothetical protein
VWSRASESWGADCEVTPVDFELKENRGKLTELLSVGKLNLPSRWELEKLTVTTKFDGNERSYHRYVEETLGKLKSQHAIDFVTIPLHAWVKKALAIQSKSHLLTPEVGGTYNEDATVEAALSPPSKKLLRHVVGLINHAKYVYGVVYRALTSTLDSEQHVKKMVETQLSTLADAFPDGTPLSDHEMADGKIKNEEQMGSVADSYALWIMLRNKYQRKHHVHVRELLDTLSATRCEANTRDAVKLFYTKLVTIEQEIRLIQGLAAEKKTLYLGLVDLRRRDGLTETLLRQLRKEELMRKWECEGKELAEWAEKMVIVYDEETSNQQSAPVSAVTKEGHNPTQGEKKQSDPGASEIETVRRPCEFCTARGFNKGASKHELPRCRFAPKGWKRGDKVEQMRRERSQRTTTDRSEGESGEKQAEKQPTNRELLAAMQKQIEQLTSVTAALLKGKNIPDSYLTPDEWHTHVSAVDAIDETREGLPVFLLSDGHINTSTLAMWADNCKVSGGMMIGNVSAAVIEHADRIALLDSGALVHIVPNDKLAVEGSVKQLKFHIKLVMADGKSVMYATKTCTITLAPNVYLHNVLIVPQMRSVIISESKLEQQGLTIKQDYLGKKEIYRITNYSAALEGAKIEYGKEPLFTINKQGARNKAGMYYHTITIEALKENAMAKPLSNGALFNLAKGSRNMQESKIKAQEQTEQRANDAQPSPADRRIAKKAPTKEQLQKAARAEIAARIKAAADRKSSSSSSASVSAFQDKLGSEPHTLASKASAPTTYNDNPYAPLEEMENISDNSSDSE